MRPASLSTTVSEETLFDNVRVFARREKFLNDHNIPIPEGNTFAYFETLASIAESGNEELFERCMNELSDLGFSRPMIEQMVRDELSNRKNATKSGHLSLERISQVLRGKLKSFLRFS